MNHLQIETALERWGSDDLDDKLEGCNLMKRLGSVEGLQTASTWFFTLSMHDEAALCLVEAVSTYQDLNSILKLMALAAQTDDQPQFLIYAHMAADLGHPQSTIDLANHYQSLVLDPPDVDDQVYLLSLKAAAFNDPRSMRCLAEWTEPDQQDESRLEWFMKAANAGDVHSLLMSATILYHGLSVPRDVPAALELFIRASRLAALPSMVSLAVVYTTDDEVVADPVKAFELFEEAARGGDVEAMRCLADVVYDGVGCERDVARAREIYQEAVDAGCVGALPNLAKCLFKEGERKEARMLM